MVPKKVEQINNYLGLFIDIYQSNKTQISMNEMRMNDE